MIPREAVFFYELGDILGSEGAALEVFAGPSTLRPELVAPYIYFRCESLMGGAWAPRGINSASIKNYLSTLNTIHDLYGTYGGDSPQGRLMLRRRFLGGLADLLNRCCASIEATTFSARSFKLTVVLDRGYAEFKADGFWDFDVLDSKICFEVAAKMEGEVTPGFYEALANSTRRIN